MNFLKKILDQPKRTRKIIFWIIVVIVGIFFLLAWIYGLKVRMEAVKSREIFEQYKPPGFEESLKSIPKIELPEPELSEEEIRQLEEELELIKKPE